MKALLTLPLFPSLFFSQGARYVLPNEEVLFSFKTDSGKKAFLVKDKNDKYLQYRFGTAEKIELQFPAEKSEKSWKLFYYNSYWRGGGKENYGEEIDNVSFTNNGTTYLLYRTYFAEDESESVGIVLQSKDREIGRIKGIPKSVEGCICSLSYNKKIKLQPELGLDF